MKNNKTKTNKAADCCNNDTRMAWSMYLPVEQTDQYGKCTG